jgi:hypothetical protein
MDAARFAIKAAERPPCEVKPLAQARISPRLRFAQRPELFGHFRAASSAPRKCWNVWQHGGCGAVRKGEKQKPCTRWLPTRCEFERKKGVRLTHEKTTPGNFSIRRKYRHEFMNLSMQSRTRICQSSPSIEKVVHRRPSLYTYSSNKAPERKDYH